MTTPFRTGNRKAPRSVSSDVTVIKHPERQRYDASAGGSEVAGFIDYLGTSELVVLKHTEVDPSFEGRGIGSALARAALDDIREHRLKPWWSARSSPRGCAATPTTGTFCTTRRRPRSGTRRST